MFTNTQERMTIPAPMTIPVPMPISRAARLAALRLPDRSRIMLILNPLGPRLPNE
jgi:hypothetical protein